MGVGGVRVRVQRSEVRGQSERSEVCGYVKDDVRMNTARSITEEGAEEKEELGIRI